MTEINFQSLLFGAFRGVCPVTFRRFFDSKHIRVLTATNPYLLEVVAVVVIIEGIDREDLLTLNGSQTENGCNVFVSVLKLGLVKKYLDVRVIDDSLLDNGRVNHVVKLLSYDSGNTVELADCLIKILDILSHSRRCDCLPSLLDYQSLTSFLDTHFL